MLVGIGVDMIELASLDKMLKRNEIWIIEKVLSKKERDYCMGLKDSELRLVWIAKCFVIKEAAFKAINHLVYEKFNFLNIEFFIDDNGETNIYTSKINLKEEGIILNHSISYTSKNVIAFVTAEKLKEVKTSEN
ncbi:holo-ACP synthase [Viridibacillus arvi]|uniref:holo-ACP synthase n=1 Tax=Viridibacillus arvi TaxID=263475 RepID=UPI003D05A4CB